MSYPVIASRRMAYDIDGTEIAFCVTQGGVGGNRRLFGISSWATQQQKTDLNNELLTPNVYGFHNTAGGFWLFFPEKREISFIGCIFGTNNPSALFIQGSNDTANGMDGTWETAIFTKPTFLMDMPDSWRQGSQIFAVSFSQPYRVLWFGIERLIGNVWNVRSLHLYGAKAATETPDDILIMENTTDEFAALKDWGNRPEGTLQISSFRVKNASLTKTANNINIQLNHNDFLLSWSDTGPWVAFVDIASLGPGAVSSPIYVKNELPPPLLILGPKAARVIVGVGNWS